MDYTHDNFWDMMKTENGMILAIFISLLLGMNSKDLENNTFCAVFCSLICAVILGLVILGICPPDLRPYVAIAFLVLSGVSFVYRMLFVDCKPTRGNFSFYVEQTTGPSKDLTFFMRPRSTCDKTNKNKNQISINKQINQTSVSPTKA